MAFTASVMPRLNVRLSEMFLSPNTAITEYNEPAMSARAVLMNQTARADERLTGNKCVGINAWFYRTSAITTVSAPSDCTTPGGNQGDTIGQNYDTEVLANAAGTVLDNRCNNELEFVEESALAIRRIIAVLRKTLNSTIITRLAAAAQVNLDTGIPASWDDTSESPKILVPGTDMVWENLGEFEAVVANNLFGDHLWLSGRNFYNDFWKAQYTRFNDSGKAEFQAYQDHKFYFDLRNMDAVLGEKDTLAIDQNSYIFWNTTFSTATWTQIGEDKWVAVIPDPELSYMKNGRLTPVLYEFEMEKLCSGRNSNTQLQWSYKYYGRLVGGFKQAPTGPNSEKGVLLFKNAG